MVFQARLPAPGPSGHRGVPCPSVLPVVLPAVPSFAEVSSAVLLACLLLLVFFHGLRSPSPGAGVAPLPVASRGGGFVAQPWGCGGLPLPC